MIILYDDDDGEDDCKNNTFVRQHQYGYVDIRVKYNINVSTVLQQ